MKFEVETDMEFNEWIETMEYAKQYGNNLIWKKIVD